MYIVVILLGTSVGASTSAEGIPERRYTEDRSSWSCCICIRYFGWCSAW